MIRKHALVFSLVFLTFLGGLFFLACSTSENTRNSSTQIETSKSRSDTSTATSNTSVSSASNSSMSTPAKDEETAASSERYAKIDENPFRETSRAPLSTFSIDVDTASYANVRRYLNNQSLPPKDAVRIEELINYFDYEYAQPIGKVPFSVNTEVASCPWNAKHKIVSIGLQGKKVSLDNTPPSNLVF